METFGFNVKDANLHFIRIFFALPEIAQFSIEESRQRKIMRS
jgi:hypothetical protein